MSCLTKDCKNPVFINYLSLCRSCYKKKRRKDNPEIYRQQDRDSRSRNRKTGKISCNKYKRTHIGRYKSAISEAKRRNLEFSLTFEFFVNNLRASCEYCGNAEITPNTGHRLDRIENDLGYNESNVVACCGDCNKIRGDRLSYIEMIVAMKAVTQFRNSVEE